MELSNSEGQQHNDHNISLSQKSPDENEKYCIECNKKFNCKNSTSDITQKCPQCSVIRPNSPASTATTRSSAHSNKSHSRKIQLQLKRLEEERIFNTEYLNKKYQLLEEAEDISDTSSNKSRTVQNWLNKVPDQDETSEILPEDRHLSAANNQCTNTNQQASSLPHEIVYCDISGHANTQNKPKTNMQINHNHQTANTSFVPIVSTASASTLSIPNRAMYTATTSVCHPEVQSGVIDHLPHVTVNPHLPRPPLIRNANFRPYQPTIINNSAPHTFLQTAPISTTMNISPNEDPAPLNRNTNFASHQPRQQSYIKDSAPHTFLQNEPMSSTMNISPNANTATSFCPPVSLEPHNRLLQSHINARQSMPKELPPFSGNPEEWPTFISTLEWSTAACNFTNAENLIRLQKSLKGEALQSVQQMLIHPANVPGVVEVLRLLYGQPEKIINSIKYKIKSSPVVDENNLKTLTTFAIKVRSLISTITASNLYDEINNSSLLFDLIQKLPPSYQMQWANYKMQLMNQNKNPNLSEFDKWIFSIGITASSIAVEPHCSKTTTNHKDKISANNKKAYKKDYVYTHSDERKCVVCNNNCKAVASCQTFLSLDRGEKWNVVKRNKLCKFCLCKHNDECRKKKKCGKEGCEYFHHSSLHRYSQPANEHNEMSNDNVNNLHIEEVVNNSHSAEIKNILFKIIPVKIYGKDKSINTYAFIDDGSSISLMDESLVNQLDVEGISNPLCLRWTGGMERTENSSQKVKIGISGGNGKRFNMNVFTVNSLNLPSQSLDYRVMAQNYRHLRNLPVKSYSNAVPMLLIGLNHFDLGIHNKVREGSPYEPVAVRTQLGWLIYGTVAENKNSGKHFNYHICECSASDNDLDKLVRSYYALDSVGISIKDPLIAESEQRALHLLDNFTKRNANGNYIVPLLWKFDLVKLPDSYDMAFKRLVCLERKLKQNDELFNTFKETLSKYLSKGYIRKLKENEIDRADGRVWYLPIFAVFNRNKPGKSRVVWDAAAKSNGSSLNSFLLKGPDFLASLPSILFKFRQKSVAICGDIEEMFHQIYIRREDRDVQRFLWRECMQEKIPEIYVMDVMIFGATCAPSISQYVKNHNAAQFKRQFPTASKSIIENHYVDDLLDSVDTAQEAIQLITEVSYIHRQAGFNIRNWICNNQFVMDSLPTIEAQNVKCLNFKENQQIEKVLGVFWEYLEDVITFKISNWLMESDIFSNKKSPTKRQMLRLVMSIYDPLGLIGHIIMYVKILMQEVWRAKIEWDESIPLELNRKWIQWVNILPEIQNIKIPRCYLRSFDTHTDTEVQLHTFVDASKDGYAAVCYFRLKKNDTIVCSIVGSKTRVAPIKITSVPRLELMAALIGSRFAKFVMENHDIKISKKYYWSDSKTVLSWINSDARKYNQFVAFRVTEILELSSLNEWKWVPSKQNVADDATKWSKIPVISIDSRWFNGPDFLHLPEEEWPKTSAHPEPTEVERVHHSFKITTLYTTFDVLRFSKWVRLLRTAAYVLRFINNCRRIKKQTHELTQEELKRAETILYRQAQSETYSAEISQLMSKASIHKSSDIYCKSPYLEDGVLRVYGRIDEADVPWEQKRPIILPRECHITKLILLHYHEKFHHMNHETAINEIRQKFSISRLRTTFKTITRSCQMCKIHKAIPQSPQMAKLPRARLASFGAPFSFTGIDFFGPILVTVNRHKEKRYGCLFTCLTIRAIHIEVAYSLTTSSCILAIRNFMARRGIPLEFYSDNGTNFVGAERELREAVTEVDKDELVKTFTSTTTKWNFNPPASPHMGGAWERLVRSIKTILYKIIPARCPSDELLLSTLIEVENIVNSRPLAYVPVDDETSEALTPNHFLVGSSSGLKPISVCSDSGILLKQNWLLSQQYANIFWKKWLAEFLPSLTCRSKWYEKSKPLCQGDLVIIVDPSLPRNVWLRGKVLQTRLASDGQVRSAKVLTQRGIMDRPVTKLAILDVAPQRESGSGKVPCHTAGGMLAALPKSH